MQKRRGRALDQEERQVLLWIKSHVSVDVKYTLIRGYAVTDAAQHDSNVFEQLFSDNTSKEIWADSANRSEDRLERLS